MLFSKLYKIIVNNVTFIVFLCGDRPSLNPLLCEPGVPLADTILKMVYKYFACLVLSVQLTITHYAKIKYVLSAITVSFMVLTAFPFKVILKATSALFRPRRSLHAECCTA